MPNWDGERNFAEHHQLITPSDSADLPQDMIVYCNAAGNVSVRDQHGVTLTYTVNAGQVIPVIAKRILATNTTVAAGSLFGLW